MEGLAKLTSFVRYCQLCGFSPFRIQIDPQTRKFQQFTYSFRHPVTWWFFLVKIIFLGGLAAIFYSVKSASILSENKEEATHLDLLNISVVLFCTTIFIIVQLNILNYSTLAEAIEYIKKADQILDSISSATLCKDSIIRRTLAGIVFSFSWVKWTFTPSHSLLELISTSHSGRFDSMGDWNLVCNYWSPIISLHELLATFYRSWLPHSGSSNQRFESLLEWSIWLQPASSLISMRCEPSSRNGGIPNRKVGHTLGKNRSSAVMRGRCWIFYRQKQDVASKLKLIQNVYNILCRSADKFISYNSVVVFFIFTIKTISFIICTYFAVYGYMHTDYALVKKGLLLFVSETLFFLIIFNAADSPVNEVCLNRLTEIILFHIRIVSIFSGRSAARANHQHS